MICIIMYREREYESACMKILHMNIHIWISHRMQTKPGKDSVQPADCEPRGITYFHPHHGGVPASRYRAGHGQGISNLLGHFPTGVQGQIQICEAENLLKMQTLGKEVGQNTLEKKQ